MSDDDHWAIWCAENAESPGATRWYAWLDAVEELLGHDCDGDQDADGYCLDGFRDLFKRGRTPAQAVAQINSWEP